MDKYLQYELMDFVQDNSFIRYVQQKSDADINKWQKWIAENPAKHELVNQAQALVSSIQFEEEKISPVKENEIWNKIKSQTQSNTQKEAKVIDQPSLFSGVRRVLLLAAAACLAIFFYIGDSSPAMINATTAYGEVQHIVLPDGSKVSLNAGSTLSYDENNFSTDRSINLEGEAFFDVVKGLKFEIQTHNGSVKVLGTSFNVFARDNRLDVDVSTGSVEVKSSQHKVVLKAGESTHIKDGAEVKTVSKRTWRSGKNQYDSTPLRAVYADIERAYDVDIQVDEKYLDQLFTGPISINVTDDEFLHRKGLEDALTQTTWPMGLQYEQKENIINISPKK